MSARKLLKLVSAHPDLAPARRFNDHTVVFTHVPKAAGTTLDHVIAAAARLADRPWLRAMGTIYGQYLGSDKAEATRSFLDISSERLAACGYLTGHLPYGVHERLHRPHLYVTILREPVARLRSQFRFGLERQGWLPGADIDELITDGKIAANGQTRQIAGRIEASEPCTATTLAAAIDNLRRYAVVGVAERFEEMLAALVTLFEWPDVAFQRFQQGSAYLDAAMERAVEAAAEKHFALDRVLYAEAAARPHPWADGLLVPVAEPPQRPPGVLVVIDRGVEFFPGETFAAARVELRRLGYEIDAQPALTANAPLTT